MKLELTFLDLKPEYRGCVPTSKTQIELFETNVQEAIKIVGEATYRDSYGGYNNILPKSKYVPVKRK